MAKQASVEFRLQAAQRAVASDLTTSEVARQLGVNPKLLQRWVKKLKTEGPDGFVGRGRGRTKTEGDYRQLAATAGLRWLGPKVGFVNDDTNWRCPAGHVWPAPYSRIAQGHGCPKCRYENQAARQRLDRENYELLAKERGFRWLGPLPKRVQETSNWMCAAEHVWPAAYSNIKNGSGCPFCAGLAKRQPDDYLELAVGRDFEWLGPIVENVKTNTNWRCSEGHIWSATYKGISGGRGCPHCAGKAPLAPNDYRTLASGRSFTWLGPEVDTSHDKTGWRCGKGHEWLAPYGSIRGGSGCPYCANQVPKTTEDYQWLAKEQGLTWIGSLPANTSVKTSWRCPKGHEFLRNFSNMMYSTGCPDCLDFVNGVLVSSYQRAIAEMLGGELNAVCGRYFIDVLVQCQGEKIAVEYDAWFWHGGKENLDAERDRDLVQSGYRVLRILSNKLVPSHEELASAIDKLIAGQEKAVITLPDWGIGRTREEVSEAIVMQAVRLDDGL